MIPCSALSIIQALLQSNIIFLSMCHLCTYLLANSDVALVWCAVIKRPCTVQWRMADNKISCTTDVHHWQIKIQQAQCHNKDHNDNKKSKYNILTMCIQRRSKISKLLHCIQYFSLGLIRILVLNQKKYEIKHFNLNSNDVLAMCAKTLYLSGNNTRGLIHCNNHTNRHFTYLTQSNYRHGGHVCTHSH